MKRSLERGEAARNGWGGRSLLDAAEQLLLSSLICLFVADDVMWVLCYEYTAGLLFYLVQLLNGLKVKSNYVLMSYTSITLVMLHALSSSASSRCCGAVM